jgi:nucleotide-binding universal stress UspA family protein
MKDFRILVATDGSAQSRLAVAATLRFPWPEKAQVCAVVAGGNRREDKRLLAALRSNATVIAETARATLARRWPAVRASVIDAPPVDGLLSEAERFGTDVIVIGWRGYGPLRRLLVGSVARNIVRLASCSVLVVRENVHRSGEIVMGFDGSPNACRALDLIAKFTPARGARVTIMRAVEQTRAPSRSLVPARTRSIVASEVKRMNVERMAEARAEVERASTSLKNAGWRTRTVVATGAPLRTLLATVEDVGASFLVVGARGTGGVRRLLLGSVAEGALNSCRVPVLIAR